MTRFVHGEDLDNLRWAATHTMWSEVFNDLRADSDDEWVEFSCGIFGFRYNTLLVKAGRKPAQVIGCWLRVIAYRRGVGITVSDNVVHRDFDEFYRMAVEISGSWTGCDFMLLKPEDLQIELAQAALSCEWHECPEIF